MRKHDRMNILKVGFLTAAVVFISSCQTTETSSPEVLVFTPGLFPYSNIERSEITVSDGLIKRQVIGAYTKGLTAVVIYDKLRKTKVINVTSELTRSLIKSGNKFKNKNLIFGKTERAISSLGEVTYEHFSYENIQCAHFAKPHRRHPTDSQGQFSSYLMGYICQSPNKTLEDQTIKAFLQQVSIKKADKITIDEAGIKPLPIAPNFLNRSLPFSEEEIKELLDKGLITEKEADEKRRETLGTGVNASSWSKLGLTKVDPETGLPFKSDNPVGKSSNDRLSELKRLLDAGLITEAEAAKKRQEIIDGI